MFTRFTYTWGLMRASWNVLKRDKSLILLPLFSGICCLIVTASFAVPAYLLYQRAGGAAAFTQQSSSGQHEHSLNALHYLGLFCFYFCNYFIITFFNTAIVACAIGRMRGEAPTLADGLREAVARIHLIAGWALLSATVGVILRIIEERSELVGRIVVGLVGIAWTVAGYLVVPVLVAQNKGPIDALKESASLLGRTWGTRIVGAASFGLLFFVLAIPAWAMFVGAGYLLFALHMTPAAIAMAALGVVYLILLSLTQSALQSIFQAAVYLYAENPSQLVNSFDGQGFPVQLLSGAMQAKA